jgi:hypothetical protein
MGLFTRLLGWLERRVPTPQQSERLKPPGIIAAIPSSHAPLLGECPKLGLGKSLSLWLCIDLGWQGLSMIVIEIGLWASC